jgi:hypothetical protein
MGDAASRATISAAQNVQALLARTVLSRDGQWSKAARLSRQTIFW